MQDGGKKWLRPLYSSAGGFGKAATLGLMDAGLYSADSAFGTPGDGDGLRMAGRTAIAAIMGGSASELSGGTFANGARTAAMQHLFNGEGVARHNPFEIIRREFPKWWGQEVSNPIGGISEALATSAKENLTIKAGVEAAYGAGGTVQGTTNLNGKFGYEVTYNKGVMLNPIGSIGGDVYSTGPISGFFQSIEFCAIGCIGVETNYQHWSIGTSIGPAAGFNFQSGVKGDF